MQAYQQDFLKLTLACGVLRFGSFTLKSGRQSPYFFNAGLFDTGAAIAGLGDAYATAISAADVPFDMLFGPAYKGIPLVTTTAAMLAVKHKRNVAFCFNRKEAKDHGEGGQLVGHALSGRVLIVDDVITAGTAIRESIDIITRHGATPAGIVLALDRQERGRDSPLSAVMEVKQQFNLPVIALLTLNDLIHGAEAGVTGMDAAALAALKAYRASYGASE
jgi:orotate phosphoribosyltransferase